MARPTELYLSGSNLNKPFGIEGAASSTAFDSLVSAAYTILDHRPDTSEISIAYQDPPVSPPDVPPGQDETASLQQSPTDGWLLY